ncbi:hypothetical protein AOLI_G00263820 [Acnodon oligacanthus]
MRSPCSASCAPCWLFHLHATSRTAPEGANEPPWTWISSDRVWHVAPKGRAAALAPVSAAGRDWAASWALQRPPAVRRKTTCLLRVRLEESRVGLRRATALPLECAATQAAARWIQSVRRRTKPKSRLSRMAAYWGRHEESFFCACSNPAGQGVHTDLLHYTDHSQCLVKAHTYIRRVNYHVQHVNITRSQTTAS